MSKDDTKYNVDEDPEFMKKFGKNIDKALNDVEVYNKKHSINDDVAVDTDMKKSIKDHMYNEQMDKEKRDNEHTDKERVFLENLRSEERTSMEEDKMAMGEYETKNDPIEKIEEELTDINASLAMQICKELEETNMKETQRKKKRSRWIKLQRSILVGLICVVSFVCFLGFTKPGNKILMNMGVNIGGKIWETWTNDFDKASASVNEDTDFLDEEDLNSDAQEVDENSIVWANHSGEGRKEDYAYNILLLGEEAIGSGTSRGRTDLIIIATLNTKEKSIKLTSLLRDTLVQIPGYQDNKLNSAYEKGGVDLLYETIALNYEIQLDGCVLVNFLNFERIIDQLGGLEITLTKGEASYLRTTNYISNPLYRDVKEGTQLLNGNQVLGYSRIRKRAAITGQNNDYGRTDRHRIILNAIFEKYKTNSKLDLASIMIGVLPMITTDIDSKGFELLLNTFIEMGTTDMDQLRIPANGTFTDNVKVRGMDVLIPDLQENVEILHNYIFGEE